MSVSHEIHPYVFWRWWKFQMRIAGVVDSGLLEHMMGHHNLRLMHGAAYDEFDPDYIRKEYSNAEPYLGSDDRPGFSWSRKCLALWRARTPT